MAVDVANTRTLIASGSDDGSILLWDPDTGEQYGESLTGHFGGVVALAVLPPRNGGTSCGIAAASGGGIWFWDVVTGRQVRDRLEDRRCRVEALAFGTLPDGRAFLAAGCSDSHVRLRDPETSEPIGSIQVMPRGRVRALTVLETPDGKTLVISGGDHGSDWVWDTSSKERVLRFATGEQAAVTALVAVPSRGRQVVLFAGDEDGWLWRWDLITGQMTGYDEVAHGAVSAITGVRLADGRNVLVIGSEDRSLRLWDLSTGRLASESFQMLEPVTSLAVTSRGLAVGTAGAICMLAF